MVHVPVAGDVRLTHKEGIIRIEKKTQLESGVDIRNLSQKKALRYEDERIDEKTMDFEFTGLQLQRLMVSEGDCPGMISLTLTLTLTLIKG